MISRLLWRKFRCPSSRSKIAQHFLDNYVLKDHLEDLDFDTAYDEFVDPWFAYRRRIGSIYGVAICYKPPDDSPSKMGWNRKLWRENPEHTPEELVELIFDEFLALLKSPAASRQQDE